MVMDISPSVNTKHQELIMCSSCPQSAKTSSLINVEVISKPAEPHGAMFFPLTCLNLFELLTMSQVCISFKDAISNDILLWLDIVVDRPLNFRINDDILEKFMSKAQGRLRSLVLVNCVRITDDGLQRVIEHNPNINKLCIPSCTQLTADGIVRAVKTLTENSNKLKFIRLENIHNITKEHLKILYSCLKIKPEEQKPRIYLDSGRFSPQSDSNPIDVEVCPKCKDVKIVYDCPRDSCKSKKERPLAECKGCLVCVPRCEGCGGCVDQEETGETACFDILCLDCWLQLPKCNMCNKPYCNQHADRIQWSEPQSLGFVCDACSIQMEEWFST